MSNTLVTCNIVAKEALAVLENILGMAKNVNRDFESEFGGNQARGYSPGQTINIKKPPRYTYRAGRVSVPQSTVETTVPLTLNQGGTDLGFTNLEATISLQQLEQKVYAACATVANEIDRQLCQVARQTSPNALGTPGTPPNTQLLALQATTSLSQRLDEEAAPRVRGSRHLIMAPALNSALVVGMAGLFNNQATLGNQYQSGVVVDSLGLTYDIDQNIDTHVNGSQAVTGTAVAAGLSGNSITCVALGGNITKGTKISFPGVFAVNPQSRVSTGVLAQFVVTADLLTGATALPIYPAITPTGAFQTTSGPTTAANFTIFGTASGSYSASVAFHRDAFTLAMVPMPAPMAAGGVDVSQMSNNGLSVKVTKYYDPINDYNGMRLDVLFGIAATYPELSCIYAL